LRQAAIANRPLGKDPETGKDIFIKTGAYGPYVQLGEPELTPKGNIKKGSKPKMASLWPDMSVDTITLDQAQLLLSFPKILGQHPEHGVDIVVQDGPYGPYILMVVEGKKDSRQLEDHEQMRKLDLAGALALFKEPKKRRSGQSRNQVLKSLGTSAVTEKSIDVKNGRFGPYVTDGVVNATIPASRNPETITLDDALELIAAREEKMREQGKDPRKKKVSIKRIRKPKSTTKKTVSKRSKK